MRMLQRFILKPLLPVLKISMGKTYRTSVPAGVDVMELAVNPEYTGKRGFFTLLKEDKSSPDSQDETKQEALWKKTLEWAKITSANTALEVES